MRIYENEITYVDEKGVQKTFKKLMAVVVNSKGGKQYFDVVLSKKHGADKQFVKKTIDLKLPIEINEDDFKEDDYFIVEEVDKGGYTHFKLIIKNLENVEITEVVKTPSLTLKNFK